MKKSQLRQIIQEELKSVINEFQQDAFQHKTRMGRTLEIVPTGDGKATATDRTYTTAPFRLDGYYKWQHDDELIQRAMPELNADDRGFLMTGFTPTEWDDMFSERINEAVQFSDEDKKALGNMFIKELVDKLHEDTGINPTVLKKVTLELDKVLASDTAYYKKLVNALK